MADKIINLFNANCCGEVGDVIVEGDINLEGKTILEQSKFLFRESSFRKFLLNFSQVKLWQRKYYLIHSLAGCPQAP